MSGIDWQAFFSIPAVITALRILVVLLLALLTLRVLGVAFHRLDARAAALQADPMRIANLRTLLQVIRSVTVIVLIALVISVELLILNINIGPILAGAGIAGLALTFGAQSLIKDFIAGTLILLENQFKIGDRIEVGAMSGTVERITLRTTYLRDWTGPVYIIPNGDIRALTNRSRDWAIAVVDLDLANDPGLERTLQGLREAVTAAGEDPRLRPLLLDPPRVEGWVGLSEAAVRARITARCLPADQEPVSNALRRIAAGALNQSEPGADEGGVTS